MTDLSREEIAKVLEKLRSEYSELGKQNPKAFNLPAFEERYYQSLKARGSTTRFLLEELNFLETLKQKHSLILEKKNAARGETLDKIISLQEQALQKYEKIDFHPVAKPESRYFYGAMVNFHDTAIPLLEDTFRGTYEIGELKENLIAIERIGFTKRGIPSARIGQHIKLLLDANGSQSLIEKESQGLLKEGCFALKKLHDSLSRYRDENLFSKDRVIKLDETSFAKAALQYNDQTTAQAIQDIIEKCSEIITDFRMKEITGLR